MQTVEQKLAHSKIVILNGLRGVELDERITPKQRADFLDEIGEVIEDGKAAVADELNR